MIELLNRPQKFDQQFPGIINPDSEPSVCPDRNNDIELRIHNRNRRRSPPFDIKRNGFVDEIHLTMKRRFAAGQAVDNPAENRKIGALQRITSGRKQIKSLTVFEENRLLRFVYNQLGSGIEILNWMFPHQNIMRSLIFDNRCNAHRFFLLRNFFSLFHFIVPTREHIEKIIRKIIPISVIPIISVSFHSICKHIHTIIQITVEIIRRTPRHPRMSRHPLPFDFPAPDGDLFIKLLSGKKRGHILKVPSPTPTTAYRKTPVKMCQNMDTPIVRFSVDVMLKW